MRYKGTVTKFQKGMNGAFIGRNTVTRADGQPADLDTSKDIFIHPDDMSGWRITLEIGQEFVFQTMTDKRRDGALRAWECRLSSDHPVEAGITLDFPSREISQPTVPISWCLEPAAFARMEADPSHDWVILIVAQKTAASQQESYQRTHVHRVVVGAEKIALRKTYFSFPDAGEWDVVAYLISFPYGYKPYKLEQWREEMYFWNEEEREVNLSGPQLDLQVAAASHEQVSVPTEIFAKPLPAGVRTWLGYFSSRPVDSCSAWHRIVPAFTLGVAWYVLWESIKRGWAFILGWVHLLIGGSPLPMWEIAIAQRLSADLEEDWGKYEYEPLTSFKGWRGVYHPMSLILYAGSGWVYLNYPSLFMKYVPFVVIVVALFMVGVGIYNLISRLRPNREEAHRAANIDRLALVRTYALSGAPQPAVPAPLSIRLVYESIKARHCKVYAKG